MRNLILMTVAMLALYACGSDSGGGGSDSESIVDFEAILGEIPVEGLEVSTQFKESHGITFSLEDGSNPVIADVGGARTAFGSKFGADTAAPNESIGKFFLTDDGILSGLTSPALTVTYDPLAKVASGVVLDIDFDETFDIVAFDVDGNTIREVSISAGDPDTGDGVATNWLIESASRNISKIVFSGHRQKNGAFGMGLDNFSSRSGE